jgi:hypothetical protein
MGSNTGNLIYNKYTLSKNINKRIACNAKSCYFYEALLQQQEELTLEEHKMTFLYLWWISTDTDLLSEKECVHKGLYEIYKNQS